MKKIIIVYIIECLLILTSFTLCGQNNVNYTGVYQVEQRCRALLDNLPTNDTIYYSIDTTQYELEVNTSDQDTIDLEINIKLSPKSYTLDLSFIDDSVFIIHDKIFKFEDYHHIEFFDSYGTFFNDSISISFGAAIANTTVGNDCSCKGRKIRDIGVSINETETLNAKLFPNPVKSKLQVLLPDNTYNKFRIYNTNGFLIKESNNGQLQSIDISDMPNGGYIISFLNNRKSIASGRFVKIE